MDNRKYILDTISAIADGYDWDLIEYSDEGEQEFYVLRVENPNYKPDNGSDPYKSIHLPANQEV